MKVVATIGGLEVPVGSYTVSPDPLVAGTTEVVLTYELDGKTATGSQSVTVNEYKTVLEENSWETIARAAAAGKAKELWNIGDTKTLLIGGTKYTFRIVAFDFQDLASTDIYYTDTSYNDGSGKTGITFMATAAMAGTAVHMGDVSYASQWSTSLINTTTLPNLFKDTSVVDYVRTVTLISTKPVSPLGYTETSDSKYYLPSVYELMGQKWYYTYDGAPDGNGRLTYFANGNSLVIKNTAGTPISYWTRSSFDNNDRVYYGLYNSNNTTINSASGAANYYLVPLFDL